MEALDGPEFRKIISEKFQINLDEYPTMYTVRGRCAPHNGQIHCDSASKIVTVLLYLNDASWGEDGGRLRVLNSPDSLDNFFRGTDFPEFLQKISKTYPESFATNWTVLKLSGDY